MNLLLYQYLLAVDDIHTLARLAQFATTEVEDVVSLISCHADGANARSDAAIEDDGSP